MRLIRDRKSTTIFKHFRIARRRPVPHRRQRQNRPILQFPPRQATEAKGFGSLFLRREVVSFIASPMALSKSCSTVARRIRLRKKSAHRNSQNGAVLLAYSPLLFNSLARERKGGHALKWEYPGDQSKRHGQQLPDCGQCDRQTVRSDRGRI